MKPILRFALVAVLGVQVWHAVHLTRYNARLVAGGRAYDNWQAERAQLLFLQAAEIHGKDAAVWRQGADVALYMHDFPEQIESDHDPMMLLQQAWSGYASAVGSAPVDPWSWTGLSEVALNRVRVSERRDGIDLAALGRRSQGVFDPDRAIALAAARIAVDLRPSGFYGLDALAAVYESVGDLEHAEELYVESARMMPIATNHAWGFRTRLAAPLYAAVLRGMREGVASAPEFERSTLHLEIGRFARSQDDRTTAIEEMELAEELAQRRFERYNAAWELARTIEYVGDYERALAAIERAALSAVQPEVLSEKIGTLQLRVGRNDDACSNLRRALRANPGDDDGLLMRAVRACELAGELSLAEQLLVESFVLPIQNLTFARALLDFYRRNGNEYLARSLLETWLRDHPDEPEIQAWARQAELEVPRVQ